jgi:tetratricopeptide (TPR) repeat protein
MIRRDYFLRMVQEMAQVLARAVLLRHRKEYDQALKEINDALRSLRADSAAPADEPSLENWLELCRRHEGAGAGLMVAVADLIKEQADLLWLRQSASECQQASALSLGLFLEALVTGSTFVSADLLARVEELIERTAGTTLPAGVLRRLADYYELRGRLDKAEDSFFELLESGDRAGVTNGLAFYDRLATKTDGELEEGGLSRAEVEEGRGQFLKTSAARGDVPV